MAKSSRAGDSSRSNVDPDEDLAAVFVASHLTTAIMQLLPAVNDGLTAHGADGCGHCAVGKPRECPTLGLIASILDRVWLFWSDRADVAGVIWGGGSCVGLGRVWV